MIPFRVASALESRPVRTDVRRGMNSLAMLAQEPSSATRTVAISTCSGKSKQADQYLLARRAGHVATWAGQTRPQALQSVVPAGGLMLLCINSELELNHNAFMASP